MALLTRLICVLLLLTALTACDPMAEPDSMMDSYLERLARVLEVESEPSEIMQVQTLPRPRDRRVKIKAMEINMLDFLSLYGCELQVVVGERNSILGRVMTPLNEVRYQLRFIDKARQCLPKVDKPQLKAQLEEAIAHKQSTLPAYFWNAVWADEPMASLMSQSKGLYRHDESRQELSVLKADIEHVLSLSSALTGGELDAGLETMGDIQQRWVFGHTPGQLINSARLLLTRLNDATALIDKRLHGKPLCYLKKPNPQAERVKGVFFHLYIGRVQPYIAQVSQAGEQVFSRLASLASSQQSLMPVTFHDYYQQVLDPSQPGNLWNSYEKAVKQHTERWQQLLGQCGMRPMAG